jgi:hypothetical protein
LFSRWTSAPRTLLESSFACLDETTSKAGRPIAAVGIT